MSRGGGGGVGENVRVQANGLVNLGKCADAHAAGHHLITYYLTVASNNHQCMCAVADVHLNTMGLNVRTRSQITVQIRLRAQENVSVNNLFVLATKLAVTRISGLTTTVEVRDCLETERLDT